MNPVWVTVAVALIGAVATLGGVIYTQRSAERREVRLAAQAAASQAFELEKAAQNATWQHRQALLERRIEAHAEFLKAAEIADRAAVRYRTSGERDRHSFDRMSEAQVLLQMFGSEDALTTSAEVCRAVYRVWDGEDNTVIDRVMAVHKAMSAYRLAMREDLRQP